MIDRRLVSAYQVKRFCNDYKIHKGKTSLFKSVQEEELRPKNVEFSSDRKSRRTLERKEEKLALHQSQDTDLGYPVVKEMKKLRKKDEQVIKIRLVRKKAPPEIE